MVGMTTKKVDGALPASFRKAARAALDAALGPEACSLLWPKAEAVFMSSGQVLFRQGDVADAFYVLVSGSLGMSQLDEKGVAVPVSRLFPPEIIGERAVLVDAPRAATITALRDCELLLFPRGIFDTLVARSPEAMLRLARLLARRQVNNVSAPIGAGIGIRPVADATTVAVIRATNGVDAVAFARALTKELGKNATIVHAVSAKHGGEFYRKLEARFQTVVYVSDGSDAAWTRVCCGRADHILALARPGAAAVEDVLLIDRESSWTRRDLVMIGPGPTPGANHAFVAPDLGNQSTRLNVRPGNVEDIRRVARWIRGRSIGLVLSGGGARGFAHVGVLRALFEAKVPIDLVAGTSIGAVIGAAVAMQWDIDEIVARIRDAFVVDPPLVDYTIPFVALTRGLKTERALARHFMGVNIEELRIPFFCVSTDLSAGEPIVHRTGQLVTALRASVAIPGLLPPVLLDNSVLVDGAMIDNLPVGCMARLGRAGKILAIDVGDDLAFVAPEKRGWASRWVRGLFGVPDEMPSFVELLLRAGTVSSDIQTRMARDQASLVIRPPIAGFGLQAWRSFEAIEQIGYDHAREVMKSEAFVNLQESLKT